MRAQTLSIDSEGARFKSQDAGKPLALSCGRTNGLPARLCGNLSGLSHAPRDRKYWVLAQPRFFEDPAAEALAFFGAFFGAAVVVVGGVWASAMTAATAALAETRPFPNRRSKAEPAGGFLRAVWIRIRRIASVVSDTPRLLASDSISATIPVTAGAAILVPDLRIAPVFVRDCAASTSWPGADTSGFWRPSRVGPELEKKDTGAVALCAS